ncbi:hypothetical protein B0T10DRAFT_472560 [Thelonectria olida]|uniref:DUF7053 domain-containing protein n=1 Tax=Thelonectria olida TaxID=1576542 RepID=A0A9P9ASL1_9HYPO|nr:hypothetical protein B0T10DRAFT_472560 [Thelonectria olida]
MTSMLRTWAELQHVTPIPAGVPASKAVQMLHDHEFFLHCDPHMVNFTKLVDPKEASAPPPEDREVHPISPPVVFSVTDRVHTLPAGLWDSDVVSTYEFFDLEDGLFVRLQSPLSVVMETVWYVRESEDGSLWLVEDVIIKCSRLLIGVVKGTCESGWKDIHKKMVEKIKEL